MESCLTLNGQTPVFQDYAGSGSQGFNDRTHAIARDLQFTCHGNVSGWAAYAERAGTFTTIRFQVWRLVQESISGCRSYELVGSHRFSNITTDKTKLLNISSVEAFGQIPIPVQPGYVVGFYGDFSRGSRININIQSDNSGNSLTYYESSVSSADVDAIVEASTCEDLMNMEMGAPVITAKVVQSKYYVYTAMLC